MERDSKDHHHEQNYHPIQRVRKKLEIDYLVHVTNVSQIALATSAFPLLPDAG
jgi:hypothetical protein